MVLNALSIDPKRPWKGSWRWFHETLLDCCLPLDTVAQEGVVLTQVGGAGRTSLSDGKGGAQV
jgi:glutathione gamma-glutamylcysteinyltransferase